ncbi:MAG TPA: BadF/BadG/BcrA/BcrD ATPase family protein [Chloroflexota bacterium]
MTSVSSDYALAVDGGQSSTSCVLGTLDGTVLGVGGAGPCNHVHQPGGPERMHRALGDSIGQALDAVRPRPDRVTAVYLALSGGSQLALEIVPTIIPSRHLLADPDAPAALASGTYGGPGIGLIAGTGTVAVAENADGERAYRGGWGYMVGDEGGGYWIGMRAVQAAARAQDGRAPRTTLRERILEFYEEIDLRMVAQRMYGGEIGRPQLAALAPIVIQAAEEGDAVAGSILELAAEELASLVEAACSAVRLTEERERVIVATGGVLRPGNPLWRALDARLHVREPHFRLVVPRFPPVIGAFLLALRLAGVTLDDRVLDRVERSSGGMPELTSKLGVVPAPH